MRVLIVKSILILTPMLVSAGQIKVAVIDTGIDPSLESVYSLCKDGHKDFTGTSLKDNHGHGSHVSGLIDQYAKDTYISSTKDIDLLKNSKIDYCQVIIKFYDKKAKYDTMLSTLKAFEWAIKQKVNIINYSAGGKNLFPAECDMVKKALDSGIVVVSAAGNEAENLDKKTYYPAMCDSRITVVGNSDPTKKRGIAESSNYGKIVDYWESGVDAVSLVSAEKIAKITGTSQSTAVRTGKIVRKTLLMKQ